ncbi:MAG: carbohydrate ABC transporter permease [candidate division KSB1 bacterium]|nr:carbohydrate ABC transporter permease [candidate division KSB1 bacterium]
MKLRDPWSSASCRARRRWTRGLIYAALILGSVVMLVPFYWMLVSSVMTESEVLSYPPVWIPKAWRWRNYLDAWRALPFTTFLRNTIVLTVGRMIPLLFSCSLVGFAFARLRARGKDFLFLLMLATMMLPSQVTMIPLYIGFAKIGWVNTFKPLIVPSFFGMPFYIFMMRQFFMTIPIELDESARIDGASTLTIFLRIILPLSKPALAAMAIFVFMWSWNDFFLPLVYLHKTEMYPLALGLQLFRSYGEYLTRWEYIMAGSVAMALPPLAVFFLSQRYFVQGVTLTGMKE